MYDPTLGRFTARDPIGYDGGSQNLYGYVQGNPLSAIDPSGLKEVKTQADLNVNFATRPCLTIFVLGTQKWMIEVANQQIKHYAENIDPWLSQGNAFFLLGWGPRTSDRPALSLLSLPEISKKKGMTALPSSLALFFKNTPAYTAKNSKDFSPLVRIIEDVVKTAKERMACQCVNRDATFRFIAQPTVLADLLANKIAERLIQGVGSNEQGIRLGNLFIEPDMPLNDNNPPYPYAYAREFSMRLHTPASGTPAT